MYNKFKYLIVTILIIIIFSPVTCLSSETTYVWSDLSSSITTNTEISEANNTGNFLNITSGSAILIEQETRSGFI